MVSKGVLGHTGILEWLFGDLTRQRTNILTNLSEIAKNGRLTVTNSRRI